ncbi:MATE family efflux transporter [Dysgonomonas sp. ZJ279]|uniref:MATE family efflux transporter n=1 Tax=Dysgonomonas sp. ZJ279 TaxID=2709796 RepID=UPI0013EDC484|nr:MATE family efflux transporter [Dysgonomonas sp. ZJ279]
MLKTANIDDLENKKISKLLWQYAIPAIIGTTVNALYNIIDRFFLGNAPDLGDDAISAIGIALPLMTVMTAVGMLVGAGSASRISIYMGMGDKESAEKVLGNALLLSLLFTLPTTVILLVFTNSILTLSGADGKVFEYAQEFLYYLLPGSIFATMCFGFNNMMRASGYPQKAMFTMLISVVANIILAPLFIFVFKLGIKGAAIATVISMFIGLCFVMHHFMNRNSMLRLRWSYVRLDAKIVKAIVSIGLSPFFIQISASTVIFLIIHQLQIYGGKVAVGAYTIANTLVMLILMTMIGLTQGMQPIVGYNYGAKRFNRVKETLNYTIKVGICIGAIGLIIGLLLPDIIVKPFNPSPLLATESARALNIVTLMLPLVGFQIVVTNFFQSIGMAKKSIFLSLSRQFLVLVPALFILPHFFHIDGVWMSLPVADLLSTLLTTALFLWQLRQFKMMNIEQA